MCNRFFSILAFLLAIGGLLVTLQPTQLAAQEPPPPFREGEVFAGVGNGEVRRFSPDGTLIQTLNTDSEGLYQTGMCFDSVGTLYTTNFDDGTMSKFDNSGNLLVYPWGGPFSQAPESCVLDADGNVYTGEVEGNNLLRKFSPEGELLAVFDVALEDRGVDWIDLAEDQCTMYYTSEGGRVKRFNVCTNTQLSDFAIGLAEPCYSLRIRPNGEVIVACEDLVYRLATDGTQIRTYPKSDYGENSFFFAMNLDPDGTTFWTAGFYTGNVYRINIETGALVSSFATGVSDSALGGLAVVGEIGAVLTDSDGDGLFDIWETQGIDTDGDGTIDLDLPAMGADPNKKDIFVEVDWMEEDDHTHKPIPGAIETIVESFANSPVDNGQGINLHVDVGPDSIDYVTGEPWGDRSGANEIPHEDAIGEGGQLHEALEELVNDHFALARHQAFHYAIFGHQFARKGVPVGNSGVSLPGTQWFLVTLGAATLNAPEGSEGEQAGTFMHELGHNLGLYHGGDQRESQYNYKPNYLSVMNYLFQFDGLIIDDEGGHYDYSRFDLPDLNEAQLSEPNGLGDSRVEDYGTKYHITPPYLCWPDSLALLNFTAVNTANGPINWDCDISIDEDPVQEDINNAGGNAQILPSYNDWANLIYTGGGIGQAGAAQPIEITEEDIEQAPEEITLEEALEIQQVGEPRVRLELDVTPDTVRAGGLITYTLTMTNVDAADVQGMTIVDTLPTNFSYVPGSTQGLTTEDPVVTGQELSWGSLEVSATTVTTLTFQAITSEMPGTYYSHVSGESTNGVVETLTNAAPVTVTEVNAVTLGWVTSGGAMVASLMVRLSLSLGMALVALGSLIYRQRKRSA